MNQPAKQKVFLFLQGPHGPFFDGLAIMLRRAGAQTWRVGFNAGDQFFWRHRKTYIAFTEEQNTWPQKCADLMAQKGITDLVLYGDTRAIHADAIALAKQRGITVHVFEEGYIRPYWISYERGGSNGNSPLLDLSIDQMRGALNPLDHDPPMPPAKWGQLRQHIFYGGLYHGFVMFFNQRYRTFRPHRKLTVSQEFRLYLKRLLLLPFQSVERRISTWQAKSSGRPYHVALLQLAHDSSFVSHSSFSDMTEFLELLIKGFSEGAPGHHLLVIKTHPLEDERVPIRRSVKRLMRKYGVAGRVKFIGGGKLAPLLNDAKSAITVNSTAGQQVLWRGMPLKAFGNAIYSKPELVSPQNINDFFKEGTKPDQEAYRIFRRFLLETSQVRGGYYAFSGRRQLYRRMVDLMLSRTGPYEFHLPKTAASEQQLRIVSQSHCR